ncbi:MAG: hypothetical protein WBZ36_04505 [Candidatus Nitrosopolaris sp.]
MQYIGRKTAPDSVSMPWDKMIDRKVKSSDNEDTGKVVTIAPVGYDLIQDSLNRVYPISSIYVKIL